MHSLIIEILLYGGLLVEVHPRAADQQLGLKAGAGVEPPTNPDVDDVDGVGHQQLVHVVRRQLHKVLQHAEGTSGHNILPHHDCHF